MSGVQVCQTKAQAPTTMFYGAIWNSLMLWLLMLINTCTSHLLEKNLTAPNSGDFRSDQRSDSLLPVKPTVIPQPDIWCICGGKQLESFKHLSFTRIKKKKKRWQPFKLCLQYSALSYKLIISFMLFCPLSSCLFFFISSSCVMILLLSPSHPVVSYLFLRSIHPASTPSFHLKRLTHPYASLSLSFTPLFLDFILWPLTPFHLSVSSSVFPLFPPLPRFIFLRTSSWFRPSASPTLHPDSNLRCSVVSTVTEDHWYDGKSTLEPTMANTYTLACIYRHIHTHTWSCLNIHANSVCWIDWMFQPIRDGPVSPLTSTDQDQTLTVRDFTVWSCRTYYMMKGENHNTDQFHVLIPSVSTNTNRSQIRVLGLFCLFCSSHRFNCDIHLQLTLQSHTHHH